MAFKVVILCAFALLGQAIAGQNYYKSGSYSGSAGSCCQSISVPSSGGSFPITSVGPISPSGIAASADLSLSGDLEVKGQLPWLSAVEFSEIYDTKGSGCVDYSCGCCDNVAITSVQGNSGCCGGKF